MVEIAILLVGYAAAVLFGFIGARQAGYTMWQSLKGGVQAPWVFLWWPVPLLLFVSAPLVLLSLAPISRRRWWFGLRRGILVLLAALWVLLCWGRMTALKQQGSPTTGCSRISNSASAV
jgi:hypothetical protein